MSTFIFPHCGWHWLLPSFSIFSQFRTNIISHCFPSCGWWCWTTFQSLMYFFVWIQWLISVVPFLLWYLQGLTSTWIFESWLYFFSLSLFVFLAALSIWPFNCLLAPLPGSRLKKKKNVNFCLLICGLKARFLPPSHVLLGNFLVFSCNCFSLEMVLMQSKYKLT